MEKYERFVDKKMGRYGRSVTWRRASHHRDLNDLIPKVTRDSGDRNRVQTEGLECKDGGWLRVSSGLCGGGAGDY